jgi:hypothetical protein
MTINTKLNLGDKIWLLTPDGILEGTIIYIVTNSLHLTPVDTQISYGCKEYISFFDERHENISWFRSREAFDKYTLLRENPPVYES